MVSGHVHGFSPATLVGLPDARYLQSLARIFLEQGEKAVDPPAIDASGMVDGEFNFQAGGVTFVDPDYDWRTGDAIQYLESRSNFTLGLEMRQDARNLLANAFFINKIFLPGEGEMTAFETQKRIEEFIRHASPIFEPVDDGNHELLNATYRALENMGKIRYSDMPHALVRHEDEEKIEISYQFENPIRDAEGRARVAQFQECYQIHAGAKEAGFDTGLKVGIAGRDAIRGTGAPAKWSTTEDEMERSTEKDEQVNALSEGAELIQQGSDAAVGAAEAAGALQQAGLA